MTSNQFKRDLWSIKTLRKYLILFQKKIKVKEETSSETMDQIQVKTEPVEQTSGGSYKTVNIKQ